MAKEISFIQSENFSDRTSGAVIDTIIIHHTEVDNLKRCLELLTKKEHMVSSHYLVDYDGSIYQLVDLEKKAWHAGLSCWRGRENINDYSVGIEIINNGLTPFKAEQIESVIYLCSLIKEHYPIDQLNIIGHSDVAPDRKDDPSKFFHWQELAKNNLGIYSYKTLSNEENLVLYKICNSSPEINALKLKLAKFGYQLETTGNTYDQELNQVINAFKRHHSPETLGNYGWDKLCDLKLDDLLVSYYE